MKDYKEYLKDPNVYYIGLPVLAGLWAVLAMFVSYPGAVRAWEEDEDPQVDEDELRVCDETCAKIFNSLEPRPYSSRELLWEFGK